MTDIFEDPEKVKTKTWITLSDEQLKGQEPISLIHPQTVRIVIDTYDNVTKIEEATENEVKELLNATRQTRIDDATNNQH